LENEIWPVEADFPSTPEQFEKIYDLYAPRIYRHILARVGNRHVAEDIAGTVFLNAWDSLSQGGEPVKNIRAFLYRIAHNLITDHYRKGKFSTVELNEVTEHRQIAESRFQAEELAMKREILVEVESALEDIDDEYRDILVWRFVDELSIEEITAITGKTSNNIYVMLHRALKKIRERIDGANA